MLIALILASLGLSPGFSLAQGGAPCEVIYVQPGANGGPPTTLWTTSSTASSMPPGPSQPSNSTISDGVGAVNTTSNATVPADAQLPTTGDVLQAPQPNMQAPADAAIYTPKGTDFDVADFNNWTHSTYFDKKNKYMKVAPGNYNYLSASDQFNKMITFWLYDGATLDIQGCTYSIDPAVNPNAPDNAMYLDVTDDFTVLGGTFWIDAGELFSQARITSMTPSGDGDSSLLVITIEEGYDKDIWKTAGPRNMDCIDDSNPDHFTRPGCNFWYFSDIETHDDGTITAKAASRAGVKEGYVLYMSLRDSMPGAIAAEDCGSLTIRGVTTNGGFSQYGMNGKPVTDYFDLLITNPPARPGFAPRVNGPTLSWRHQDNFDFCADCMQNYHNCFWQYTGNQHDLKDMANETLPSP